MRSPVVNNRAGGDSMARQAKELSDSGLMYAIVGSIGKQLRVVRVVDGPIQPSDLKC